jgi:hypothetical protein
VIDRPGALFGLPPGIPDPVESVALFRYVLCTLAVGWAGVVWRARRPWWTAAGSFFVLTAFGFWIAALGCPYGVLADPPATLRAAEIAVAARAGGAEGVLAGDADPDTVWTRLAHRGVPEALLQQAPTFLPLLALLLIPAAVHALWRPRAVAAWGALLLLAFVTGELDAVRGVGLAAAAWRHPEATAALPLLVAAVLALGRAEAMRRAWPLPAALVALAAAALPGSVEPLGLGASVLLLTFDQGPWLILGGYGLWRRGDPAARALAAGGAALVGWAGVSSADPFAGHALYRVGLLLGAAPVVARLAERAGALIAKRVPGEAAALGGAALVLALAPATFLAWWDPNRLDGAAHASMTPLSGETVEVMRWIDRETPKDAVVLASPDYAPMVAVLAGRRVLRAPTLAQPLDEWRRLRAESAVLEGRDPRKYVARYGVTFVLVAPTEFGEYGLTAETPLDAHGYFRLRYHHPEGYRVYQLVP